MKTIVALSPSDVIQRLGLATPAEIAAALRFERLCVDALRAAWELHLDVLAADAAPHLPLLRTALQQAHANHVRHVVLRARYHTPIALPTVLEIHWPDVCFDLETASACLRGYLEPCRWELRDGTLRIYVASELAVRTLTQRGAHQIIAAWVQQTLQQSLPVDFAVGDFHTELAARRQERENEIQRALQQARSHAAAECQSILYDSGRATPRPPVAISELVRQPPLRKLVTLHGTVVSYTPGGTEQFSLEKFALTDYTSTLECVLRPANGRDARLPNSPATKSPGPLLKLERGDWLAVTGVLDKSLRDDELELRVERVERIEPRVRRETSSLHRVELHTHTKMSQMDGLTDLAALIERAALWRHPAIGITDHGNVHAFPDAYALGRKFGIKVLLGVEAYLVNFQPAELEQLLGRKESGRVLSRDDLADFKRKVHHLIIYARSPRGLRNLYELVSLSHCKYFYNKPLIPRAVLQEYRDGLLLGSACECGEVFQLALAAHLGRVSPRDYDARCAELIPFYDYLEIQPRGNNAFYVTKGILASEADLLAINRRIYELGKKFHKPVVATGDVHVLDEHEMLFRRVLQISQGYDKDPDESTDAPLYFKTTEEMLEEFAYLGEEAAREVVVDNPQFIAAQIESLAPIPSGFHPPKLAGAEEELTRLCYARAHELYGTTLHPLVQRRLERELNDIISNHFADLYLLAQKVVRKSLDDGYIVGSRGSVGSSFVAYLAGITEVNSLPPHYVCPQCSLTEFIHYDETGAPRHAPLDGISAEVGVDLPPRACPRCRAPMQRYGFDIPFETFVGFEGNKTPDIDLNFASEYQARAHRFVEELFGKEYVYRAGTISTLQSKVAYGMVKKYLESTGARWPRAEIDRVVEGLSGIKRTTGQHPGGIIILPRNKAITEFCPVQFPANKTEASVQTTHFDYHAMEEQLLKLDILGHDDPTQIRLLSDYLRKDVTSVPLDDKKTLALFSSVKPLGVSEKAINCKVGTYGIPEFGTEFVRGMLEETRPKTFADLIRISGLSHGTDVWLNNARDYIKSGQATLRDAICPRDDIMLYLINKGVPPLHAFKIMEQVRKGKGLKPEDIEVMKRHHVPNWYIESCQKIKYMFPKAHAVAYVLNAVRIAYCKVHHPVAFYATYFTVMRHAANVQVISQGKAAIRAAMETLLAQGRRKLTKKDEDELTVYEVALEMFERGIRMRNIDLYKSDAVRCVIDGNDIIPPFLMFSGLGEAQAQAIVRARQQGPFTSREDFQRRTSCNRTLVEDLTKAGILACLPESDQMDFFSTPPEPTRDGRTPTSSTPTTTQSTPTPPAAPPANCLLYTS
ncbi:MAG: PolC-type DNA polymerase III, partial [bacterium]|nr:PolC-type DNA polymerase III [bacterium]